MPISRFLNKASIFFRSCVAKKCCHSIPQGVPGIFCSQCISEEIEEKIEKLENDNKIRRDLVKGSANKTTRN